MTISLGVLKARNSPHYSYSAPDSIGSLLGLFCPHKPSNILCRNHEVQVAHAQATHAELFEPPLPEAKVAAMGGLTIGPVDKLFLDFGGLSDSAQNPPAWGDPPVAYHLLWDDTWDAHACDTACPDTSAQQVGKTSIVAHQPCCSDPVVEQARECGMHFHNPNAGRRRCLTGLGASSPCASAAPSSRRRHSQPHDLPPATAAAVPTPTQLPMQTAWLVSPGWKPTPAAPTASMATAAGRPAGPRSSTWRLGSPRPGPSTQAAQSSG